MRSVTPRMATESDVDIRSAHPYWGLPVFGCCSGSQWTADQLLELQAGAGTAGAPVHVQLRFRVESQFIWPMQLTAVMIWKNP